jgi:hypothetical protein
VNSIAVARVVRETATSVWIGGQLFAVAVMPRAAASATRWRDRRRVMTGAWELWSPVAIGAVALATAASILELNCAKPGPERQRARLRAGSAFLALASTSAATVIGEISKSGRAVKRGSELARDASGYPIALTERSIAEAVMAPLNVLHTIGAAGLLLAEASHR